MTDDENDPLKNFEVIEQNAEPGVITIRVHRYILGEPRQREALARKLIEVLERHPNLSRIDVHQRE